MADLTRDRSNSIKRRIVLLNIPTAGMLGHALKCSPPELPLPLWGDPDPPSIAWLLWLTRDHAHAKRHLDRSSRFCRIHPRYIYIDTQTDHATTCAAIRRICMVRIRCCVIIIRKCQIIQDQKGGNKLLQVFAPCEC